MTEEELREIERTANGIENHGSQFVAEQMRRLIAEVRFYEQETQMLHSELIASLIDPFPKKTMSEAAEYVNGCYERLNAAPSAPSSATQSA